MGAKAERTEPWRRDGDLTREHEGQWVIRRDDWKLVSDDEGGYELYELAGDRTELNDLTAANPDKARELLDGYRDWAGRAGVLDWQTVVETARASGWAGMQAVIVQDR